MMTVTMIRQDGTELCFKFVTHCAIQQLVDALEENEPNYKSITIQIVNAD